MLRSHRISTISIFFILLLAGQGRAASLSDAVVKVFVTANSMDYYRPWQSKGIAASVGSGSIIEGNRILTNAHVVADHTFIQVKKANDPKKYTARLLSVGHDCDLALLVVDDPEFFKGVSPLAFGDLPELQDAVTVLGYPRGGDKLSLTEGVVSRVELTAYAQSGRTLLTVQIDAAINPGNSGGPVLREGKLVGVAMQALKAGQNIGYMIPMPIVRHFLKDVEDGEYHGFPVMGIDFETTENAALRKWYQINSLSGGVVVSRVLPFSPADGLLKEGDVILGIDGVPIAEDGTFQFRAEERLLLTQLITKNQIGEPVELKVMRQGRLEAVMVPLTSFAPLVSLPHHFKKPMYYIHAGLVFTVLSIDLLKSWGGNWWEKAPIDFSGYYFGDKHLNHDRLREVVVLLQVLPDDINVGYHRESNQVIRSVNGQAFDSFQAFVRLMEIHKKKEAFLAIGMANNGTMILSNQEVDRVTQEILERNHIAAQASDEVKGWLRP